MKSNSHASKSPERKDCRCIEWRAIRRFFRSKSNNNKSTKGDNLMKRFLGVLIASMFLASAAYAADTTKEDSKTTEKKADEKGKSDVKKSDKAKSGDTKGGAMGDEKAGDK